MNIKKNNVSEKTHKEVKRICSQCSGGLLLFVHKNYKKRTCILGCGFCGHKNEIDLKTKH